MVFIENITLNSKRDIISLFVCLDISLEIIIVISDQYSYNRRSYIMPQSSAFRIAGIL